MVLFKREWKSNYKIFLIFIAIMTLYESIIVAMYDPKLGESLNMMAESMPQLFADVYKRQEQLRPKDCK